MAQTGKIVSSTFNGSCQYILEWEAVEYSTYTRIKVTGSIKTGSTLTYTELTFANGNFDTTVYLTETSEQYNKYYGSYSFSSYNGLVAGYSETSPLVLSPNSTYLIREDYLELNTTRDEYGNSKYYYSIAANSTTPYFIFINPNPTTGYDQRVTFQPDFEGDIVLEPQLVVSTLACPDAYVGDTVKIIVTKNKSSYVNTITYQFGDLSGTIATNSSATTISWTIPWEFLQQIPSGSSHATCTLTCTTTNPSTGTEIGTSTTTFICRMDVNMLAPTFNPVIVDTNAATIALTGNNEVFIKYFSTAQVTIGAVPQDGATVVTQSAENGGKTLYGEVVTFSNVESGTFKLVATDNRTATSSTTVTKSMINYTKLSSNIVESSLNTSGNLYFKAQGNYYNSSFGAVNNTLTLQYAYSVNGGNYTSWTTITPTISGSNYTLEVNLSGFDYRDNITIKVQVADKLMTVISAEASVTGKTIFDWGKNDFNFNVPVTMQEGMILANGGMIQGLDSNGTGKSLLQNSGDDLYLGFGSYTTETGSTNIYGNNINLFAANDITVNGKSLTGNTVLWSGANLMGSGTTITLSDNISNQSKGVVLVFSLYRNSAAEDVSITTAFVSKKEVELLPGAPHTFLMAINAGFSSFGSKYLYISDTTIAGHEGNTSSGTAASGLTFANGSYVLRYVIGV